MNAKKCSRCGCREPLTTKRECGSWGREISLCSDCNRETRNLADRARNAAIRELCGTSAAAARRDGSC